MKSSILITSYLWKDTWSRWFEQPGSVLARLSVGFILVGVAIVILVSLSLLEREIRKRLEGFGVNTIVVREMISALDPELMPAMNRTDRLAGLAASGQKLRLRQLFTRAQTDWQSGLPVFTYSPDSISVLAPLLSPSVPAVCIDEKLPENIQIRAAVGRWTAIAVTRRGGDLFRALGVEKCLLVPQGWSNESERLGFTEITVFVRDPQASSTQHYVEVLKKLYALERRDGSHIQSALPIIGELEQLEERQRQWRRILAWTLGATVALVYGAIAVLEFRWNLFVTALLRSLGAPSLLLYVRQWLEGAFLANIAALSAILLVAAFLNEICDSIGFTQSLGETHALEHMWSAGIDGVLVWVNLGAFLSTLPAAIGLRRPVGETLS